MVSWQREVPWAMESGNGKFHVAMGSGDGKVHVAMECDDEKVAMESGMR